MLKRIARIFKSVGSEDLCNEFIQLKSLQGLKQSTISTYHTRIQKHILPILPIKAGKIKKKNMEKAFLKIMEMVNKNTFVDIVLLANDIFKYGYEQNYIHSFIKLPCPSKTEKEISILTDEEQDILIEYLLNHINNVNFGFLLLLYAGLRIGELSALRLKKITHNRVKIRKTLQRIKNINVNSKMKTLIVEDTPKSYASIRDVPLDDVLSACYNKINKTNEEFYLLTDSYKYMEPRQIEREFKKVLKKCGIKPKSPHVLRHTYATNAVRCGMKLKYLAELMGHSDSKVTLKYYVFVNYEMKAESVKELSEKLNAKFLNRGILKEILE